GPAAEQVLARREQQALPLRPSLHHQELDARLNGLLFHENGPSFSAATGVRHGVRGLAPPGGRGAPGRMPPICPITALFLGFLGLATHRDFFWPCNNPSRQAGEATQLPPCRTAGPVAGRRRMKPL